MLCAALCNNQSPVVTSGGPTAEVVTAVGACVLSGLARILALLGFGASGTPRGRFFLPVFACFADYVRFCVRYYVCDYVRFCVRF
jgi:hypothetical protein